MKHIFLVLRRRCTSLDPGGLKQYQQQLRLDLARRLLKDSDWAVEIVAERRGFASPQALRAAWRREAPVAPSLWRAQP
ncbi:helix-turn-helix domain-containing protein [Cupriavidus basilensis]